MARITGNIIGNYDQSAGNLTFTTWKGIQVMKSKAEKVSNPQTEGQMIQRNRLSAITFYNSWLRGMYIAGFAKLAVGKSEYNVFSSRNIMTATQSDPLNVRNLILENLQLSSGNTGNPSTVIASNSGGQVKIEWDTTPVFPNDSTLDKVYCAALIQPTSLILTREAIAGTITTSIAAVERGVGQVTFDAPDSVLPGQTVHTFLFMFNQSTKEASNSVHTSFVF